MARFRSRTFLAIPAILALVSCARFPQPEELAERIDKITGRVNAHGPAIRTNGFAKSRGALDLTLREIGVEYGEGSTAVPQAAMDAALLVNDAASANDSVEYFRRALDAYRVTYGPLHRETAFALHDYGRIQVLAADSGFAPAATAWYREALEVRRRVLGNEHPETAGSERSVAEQLLATCRFERRCGPADPLLIEAETLAEHSWRVLRARSGDKDYEVREIAAMLRLIRRASQDSTDAAERHPETQESVPPTL